MATRRESSGLAAEGPRDELIDDRPPEDPPPDHLAAIEEGLAQTRRGEFASDYEVEAILRRLCP